jgi:hypothetical protein
MCVDTALQYRNVQLQQKWKQARGTVMSGGLPGAFGHINLIFAYLYSIALQ